MNTTSLPSISLVGGADAVIAVFGQFNLHDAELSSVRLTIGLGGVPMLDADFLVPGAFALPVPRPDVSRDYRITLRCTDFADLALADFDEQNVVAEYAFESLGAEALDDRAVHVSVTSAPGCDFDLRCRAIDVIAVEPVSVARF